MDLEYAAWTLGFGLAHYNTMAPKQRINWYSYNDTLNSLTLRNREVDMEDLGMQESWSEITRYSVFTVFFW